MHVQYIYGFSMICLNNRELRRIVLIYTTCRYSWLTVRACLNYEISSQGLMDDGPQSTKPTIIRPNIGALGNWSVKQVGLHMKLRKRQ